MTAGLNETHDVNRRSWVVTANDKAANFPIQNLPFGVFRRKGSAEPFRCGLAIGQCIVDVAPLAKSFEGLARDGASACMEPALNALAKLGPDAWSCLRSAAFDVLSEDNHAGKKLVERHLILQSEAELALPFRVRAFTDFFASIHHATNAGRMFRPDQPLLPNYKYVPIAYNGRASTLRVTGHAVRRPRGQFLVGDDLVPQRLPSRALDYEAELGFFIGRESTQGEPIAIDRCGNHIFGLCLLNDWSARDIQSWEYQPLGPYLAKSFATTISPWVVTEEALRPFRAPAFQRPADHPRPLPYLQDAGDSAAGGLDVTLEVHLKSARMIDARMDPVCLSRCSSSGLYWTPAQMVAHQTSNGCNIEIGDLIGSGTISGSEEGSFGSLLEITRRGANALQLPTGESRAFLEDGDEVTLSGFCERPGFARIGLGSCIGTILSSISH